MFHLPVSNKEFENMMHHQYLQFPCLKSAIPGDRPSWISKHTIHIHSFSWWGMWGWPFFAQKLMGHWSPAQGRCKPQQSWDPMGPRNAFTWHKESTGATGQTCCNQGAILEMSHIPELWLTRHPWYTKSVQSRSKPFPRSHLHLTNTWHVHNCTLFTARPLIINCWVSNFNFGTI